LESVLNRFQLFFSILPFRDQLANAFAPSRASFTKTIRLRLFCSTVCDLSPCAIVGASWCAAALCAKVDFRGLTPL
jgi:hypothetical protein